jgi:hypothetical protein
MTNSTDDGPKKRRGQRESTSWQSVVAAYFVTTIVYRYERKETVFDYHVFNGIAFRDGKEWPLDEDVWVDTENPTPLQVIHSGLCLPRVMHPGGSLVVVEELSRKLESIPNVKLLPVEFLKVLAVELYDPRQRQPGMPHESEDFLKSLPDDVPLRARMPNYFEILSCPLHTIWDRYKTSSIDFDFGDTPSIPQMETIKICREMFDDYPVIHRNGFLMSPRVAEIIVPELDRRFFFVRKLKLPAQ